MRAAAALLAVLLSARIGWCWEHFGNDDIFLRNAKKEIDAFHRALHDMDESASHGIVASSEVGGGNTHSGMTRVTFGGTKNTGHSNAGYSNEGKSGSSGKEHATRQYKGIIGMKTVTDDDEQHTEKSHHNEDSGEKKAEYKKEDSHKKTNFSKGFRDKYHLDEIKKNDKFWSNKHVLDKYLLFGKHRQHHESKEKSAKKKEESKADESATKQEKKGEQKDGHESSEHKGHKAEAAKQSMYAHKRQYGGRRRQFKAPKNYSRQRG